MALAQQIRDLLFGDFGRFGRNRGRIGKLNVADGQQFFLHCGERSHHQIVLIAALLILSFGCQHTNNAKGQFAHTHRLPNRINSGKQIVSDGFTARVGSLTADKERFMPWRTIKNEDDKPLLEWQLETLVRGFFDRELFLDYIRFFILFETDGERVIKKIAGYHQFHAVREAVRATVIAAQQIQGDSWKVAEPDRKSVV